MKVLVVSNGFPPRGRFGTEFYTRELVHGLRARGHELLVLHPERDGRRPRYGVEELEEEGVRILLLENPGDPRKRFVTSYADPAVDAVFGELLARHRPDVVHFTYLLWGLSVGLPTVARARGIPSALTLTDYGLLCHRGQMFDCRLERCGGPHPPEVCAPCIRTPAPYDLPPTALARKRLAVRLFAALGGLGRVVMPRDVAAREAAIARALADADALVAPTANVRDAFVRGGVPAERIETLCYAFDEAPYREVAASPAPATPRFGFFGQLAPHKGLDVLLEAVRTLARTRSGAWELVLHGGAGSHRHATFAPTQLAAAPPERVQQGAPFEPQDAPRILAGLTALVVPSVWDENAPLAVLQARAAGVPVIGSDVPGIAEVVEDGVHGRLVPPGDAAALAAALAEAVDGRLPRSAAPGLPVPLPAHLDRVEALYVRIREAAATGPSLR